MRYYSISVRMCLLLLFAYLFTAQAYSMSLKVESPDKKLVVFLKLNDQGCPGYEVLYEGKGVLKESSLGLICNGQSLYSDLKLVDFSQAELVSDDYKMLLGKKSKCYYAANRRVISFQNQYNDRIDIEVQVSNDGAAFRYCIPEADSGSISIEAEKTSFAFAKDAIAWLHPMPVSKSGWSKTQPSYEEYYSVGKPVGQPSPFNEGWCFPALFKTNEDIWVLISETNVDGKYCGTRLGQDSSGGIYKIDFPQAQEHRGPVDPVSPKVDTPFTSPWRVIIVGKDLDTIVSSTLITDLAGPCKIANTDFVAPGKAAWHWIRYGDDSATLEFADKYLDFAEKMNWQYVLIDCNWDRTIGYEKIAGFVKKAKARNIGVILWYNSNGPWNDAPMTPKDKMHERDIRRKEFARLKDMGVAGVKVDFFGGDKQATMKLYCDIFADAADFGIMVNCHGTTIPRGWQRTYPNLVTMESVRGMEYCTFEQRNADQQPQHCTILPFTRNVIGSMDFTPIVFNPKIRSVTLKTSLAFELALSVVFESGIQHFALSPEEYDLMPEYVVKYLQEVPVAWDDTKLVAGYPGEYVVMARRKGDKWYIAGINGTDKDKNLNLDLSFIPNMSKGNLITDGPDRSFNYVTLDKNELKELNLEINPNGGFVLVVE